MSTSRYLNLGCGHRFLPEWINMDVVAIEKGVIAHDLSKGIPLPDQSVDVVYQAAMLEHLRRPDALSLMRECYRVLSPRGVLRVGVPDLEKICTLYLDRLAAAVAGDTGARADCKWMTLELLDQCVREQSGGEMAECVRDIQPANLPFVLERIGVEGRDLVNAVTQEGHRSPAPPRRSVFEAFRRRLAWWPEGLRRRLLKAMYGPEAFHALEIGRFRLAGEVHHWMYDRYSLGELMKAARFRDPVVVAPSESRVPGWSSYNLDVLPDGTVIKPDLFFMEAVKS